MSETMSGTDDPEIIIEPDVEEGAVAAEAPAEQAAQEDTVAPAIETLKAQLADAKAARLAAERREREAAEAAAQARTGAHDANLNMVNGAIERVKQDTATLKLALKEAWTVGDYDKAADIQEAMATNAANLMQLTNGKAAMEAAPPQKAPLAAPNLLEYVASQLSPASAAWVRAHPESCADQNAVQDMLAAHKLALRKGHVAETDSYFRFIENALDIEAEKPLEVQNRPRTPDPAPQQDESPMSEAAAPAQRRSAPPAAPVSRQNVPGQKPNVMRLTQAEANMAADMGMTVKEYAANKAKLIAEGRL